jgi:signal transduction histidine kinase
VSSRLAALEPKRILRHRAVHPLAAPVLSFGATVVIVIALLDPRVLPLIALLGFAMLAGASLARAREGAVRARNDERLEVELRTTIQKLRRSRARVAHVADAERRRIERDLHDGCQQRLIALRIKLTLAEEIVGEENRAAGDLIQEIAVDAETALDDLHALVHGIYPALLIDRGLADAVKAMARSAPVRARVLAEGVERYPSDVEAAVYFTCAEALQNAAKHGGPGTSARIALRHATEGLAFEVHDDGCGYDISTRTGSGLANMEDRLAAVGGRLKVLSAPACGTTVQGWVPDTALDS